MLLAVSGNIGAGKTTLVQRLSEHFDFEAAYEAVEQNPYLELFYEDMARWSFPLQVYFLSHRFRQGLKLREKSDHVVQDRTIYEDAHIFAKNLHESGFMTGTDHQTYRNLYDHMVPLVPAPDLLIFLKGNPEILAKRISGRGKAGERKFEGKIPQNYLADLNKKYDYWIERYDHSPVIQIDIEKTDLNDEESFEKLVETVQRFKNA